MADKDHCTIHSLDAEYLGSFGSVNVLLCPYCGHGNDSRYWLKYNDTWDCEECGNTFDVDHETTVTLYTKRRNTSEMAQTD